MALQLATITGDKQLRRQLVHLEKRVAKRAMTAGINAGMTRLIKGMRAAIDATPAPAGYSGDGWTNTKKEARRSIGKRFRRGGTNRMGTTTAEVAKTGFKVGKKKSKQDKRSKSTSGGVGIGIANIHWFVLGTDERQQSSGRPTGKIEPVFGNVTDQAMATSSGAALAAARKKVAQVILREAAKRR